MPKLTVVMPSLNVEKYIRKCVDSVLGQSLRDIEVLAIDAGSTDGTLDILMDYEKKDKRFKVILSDRKSYGYQVNLGLCQASGDYIWIVETDDVVADDAFETLYMQAVSSDADYVKGRGMFFADLGNGSIWEHPIWPPILNPELFGVVIAPCNMAGLIRLDIFLWTGLYKREFLKNIRLNETPGAAYQDQGFLFQTISTAKRAVYINRFVYHYRQDNSRSSIFNPNGFRYFVGEYPFIKKFLQGKDKGWEEIYYIRMFNQCMGRFDCMLPEEQFWSSAAGDINTLRKWISNAVSEGKIVPEHLDDENRTLLEMFIRSPYELYLRKLKCFSGKACLVRSLYHIVEGRDVVIFGCGSYGKFAHALLQSNGRCHIAAFADNNGGMDGMYLQGIEVMLPHKAVERFKDALYVITLGVKNSEKVVEQLAKMGIAWEMMYPFRVDMDMQLFRI